MKHQQNNEKEVSAIAFMRSFDETMNLMESIGDSTAKEQKTLQESAVQMENYTDDEGVFNMGSLLDVDVADTEENQPRMYNTPVEDLTDSDKQLIVDEFAEQLSKMHEEVIDFSDVGPIATVIQDKFGYKQNLEEFLTGLMTSAADKQDSQAFAHGKPIPGVAASEMAGMSSPEEGGPTDIEPEQAGPTDMATGETTVMGDEAGLVADANEIAIQQSDEMGLSDTMEGEPLREPEADESEAEQVVEDVTGMEIPEGDVVSDTEESSEDLESAEMTDETEGDMEMTGGEDDDDLDIQLEAIRTKHLGQKVLTESELDAIIEDDFDEESLLDAQLESIRNNLLEGNCGTRDDKMEGKDHKRDHKMEGDCGDRDDMMEYGDMMEYADMMEGKDHKRDHKMEGEYPSSQDNDHFMASADEAEEMARKGADAMKDAAFDTSAMEDDKTTPKMESVLESIAKKYHAKENAKVAEVKSKLEAIESEKKLDAQLEAIAGNYHAGEKAKVEAIEAELKLDEKLSTLVESYHSQCKSSNDSKANLEARKEVKEKISKLSK